MSKDYAAAVRLYSEAIGEFLTICCEWRLHIDMTYESGGDSRLHF